jgi:hypothetical protein
MKMAKPNPDIERGETCLECGFSVRVIATGECFHCRERAKETARIARLRKAGADVR